MIQLLTIDSTLTGYYMCFFQDASSVATFKSCLAVIETLQPDAFLLENVDLGDGESPESNLSLIVEALESLGYVLKTYRIISLDWGLPQRRLRIYLAGFSTKKQPNASLSRMEKHLNLMQLKCQRPDPWCMLKSREV